MTYFASKYAVGHRVIISHLFSAITGFETANKYVVKNSMGQQVYFAAEGAFGALTVSE